MVICACLLLVFFKNIELSISAGDDDVGNSLPVTTSYHESFDTLVDTAGNNNVNDITNITVLSSNVVLSHFKNITIIGDYINCNSNGSVKFVSCSNVTIKSVCWTKCGTSANPTIEFYNSSNIVLCNCSFNNSTGQAVVLSKVSGNVSINNCQFTHNKEYEGHGAAIQVSQHLAQLNVLINNCDFSFNGPAESVVYFNGTPNYNDLIVQNSTFTLNQGVPIYISHTSLILNNIVSFKDNKATAGGAIYASHSHIIFHGRSDVTFYSNIAQDNGGCLFLDNCNVSFVGNSATKFLNNTARNANGSAVYSNYHTNIIITDNSSVTFRNNYAQQSGGAVFCEDKNLIDAINTNLTAACRFSFSGSLSVTFINNGAGSKGGAIYGHVDIIIDGETLSVLFDRNYASIGAAISCVNSYISFNQSRSVNFTNHPPVKFGVIHAEYSHIRFGGTSTVTFSSNRIPYMGFGGSIITLFSSGVKFTSNSSVIFANNVNMASTGAGAIYASYSSIMCSGNASVTFSDGKSSHTGGAITIGWSNITLTGNTSMKFVRNQASDFGGAIYGEKFFIKSNESSSLLFDNNLATGGGAIYAFQSSFSFNGKGLTLFINNNASTKGGAIHILGEGSMIKFGNTIKFINNSANDGGAIYGDALVIMIGGTNKFINNSEIIGGGAIHAIYGSVQFDKDAQVQFSRNVATNGAAMYISRGSVTSNGNSVVAFDSNRAEGGGSVYSTTNSDILFNDNSSVCFIGNSARYGAAIHLLYDSTFTLKGRTTALFSRNTATQGGAVYALINSFISFNGGSNVTFSNNTGTNGGALYLERDSGVLFSWNTLITFINNKAGTGGAIYVRERCFIEIKSVVNFSKNRADRNGGSVYCDRGSTMKIQENGFVTFTENFASDGGAVFVSDSDMTFAANSLTNFTLNNALLNGGGVYLENNFIISFNNRSNITYMVNNADRYGGAIYADLTQIFHCKISVDSTTHTIFDSNTASSGNDIFLDIPISCNSTCTEDIVKISNNNPFYQYITTSVSDLIFYQPAKCINPPFCSIYVVKNIMLGQEIIIEACVKNNLNKAATATRFKVKSKSQGYLIWGSDTVSISCEMFRGIRIMGDDISNAINITLTIVSITDSQSDLKTISKQLITELSPCHPGFYYDDKKCVCYDDNDIITCYNRYSFIRKGYWFGVVSNKSTVAVCPNHNCKFTCCETANGFYQLSPMRINQCSLHRSGTACGSCEEGYTLSFDSVECVSVDKCTTGQTVLVVTLSMIYWIVIVVLVFIMTYYPVGIGYLYAITYYYSVLDILLSQNLDISQGLFLTVSTISSLAKITPLFLGRFCLADNMSGIDLQFIHYVHPLAVTIIIVMISLLARISLRFSAFVSRGIIRTVCFLLLLSYTSVATTSLLLLRPLTFENVDKVYTYLSPDIEYCHGLHLPYFIVAVLCTLVIVIGLPLLLLLEPFLNHKINFTKMKPLLDQFQGCYKDKYRCFAAYYMICRILIILVFILFPSRNDLSRFLLTFSSVILTAIVAMLKPYIHQIFNLFDGLILLSVFLATLTPLSDNVSQQLFTATVIIATILPLIFFIALELIVRKETIKNIAAKIIAKFSTTLIPSTNDNDEVPMGDIGLVIDNRMRENATICEIPSNTSDDATHYRESFMEVMDQIED